MIKKNSRPVRRVAKSLMLYTKPPPNLFLKLLRDLHRLVVSKGRVIISYHYTHSYIVANYEGDDYRVVADTIYVGKKRCKDPALRRLLRQVKSD